MSPGAIAGPADRSRHPPGPWARWPAPEPLEAGRCPGPQAPRSAAGTPRTLAGTPDPACLCTGRSVRGEGHKKTRSVSALWGSRELKPRPDPAGLVRPCWRSPLGCKLCSVCTLRPPRAGAASRANASALPTGLDGARLLQGSGHEGRGPRQHSEKQTVGQGRAGGCDGAPSQQPALTPFLKVVLGYSSANLSQPKCFKIGGRLTVLVNYPDLIK